MTELRMDALTARQREVLGEIACGQDGGHPTATLEALERKGLIVGFLARCQGWPPVIITRWQVPLDVHMQWAQWCADQPGDGPE